MKFYVHNKMKLHVYKIRKNKEYCKLSMYCYFKKAIKLIM